MFPTCSEYEQVHRAFRKKNMWRGKPVSVFAGHSKSDATAFARMVSVLLQGGVSAGAVSVFCRVESVWEQCQYFAEWCQYFAGWCRCRSSVSILQGGVSSFAGTGQSYVCVFSRICQCFRRVVSVLLWGCYSGVSAFAGQWCQFLFWLGSVCVVSAFAGNVLQGGVRVSVFAGQCQYFCMGVSVLLQSSSIGHV